MTDTFAKCLYLGKLRVSSGQSSIIMRIKCLLLCTFYWTVYQFNSQFQIWVCLENRYECTTRRGHGRIFLVTMREVYSQEIHQDSPRTSGWVIQERRRRRRKSNCCDRVKFIITKGGPGWCMVVISLRSPRERRYHSGCLSSIKPVRIIRTTQWWPSPLTLNRRPYEYRNPPGETPRPGWDSVK